MSEQIRPSPRYAIEYDRLHQYAIKSGDDRVIALTVGGYIERGLRLLLEHALPCSDQNLLERLFGENRPLQSVSARLDLAKAMGLISAQAHTELRTFFKIRNLFAHDSSIEDANDPRIAGRTSSMTLSHGGDQLLAEDYSSWSQRSRFQWSALYFAGKLLSALNQRNILDN